MNITAPESLTATRTDDGGMLLTLTTSLSELGSVTYTVHAPTPSTVAAMSLAALQAQLMEQAGQALLRKARTAQALALRPPTGA